VITRLKSSSLLKETKPPARFAVVSASFDLPVPRPAGAVITMIGLSPAAPPQNSDANAAKIIWASAGVLGRNMLTSFVSSSPLPGAHTRRR